MSSAPVNPGRPRLTSSRWASTPLDIPARKPLYRLFASLHGLVLEATVFSHGPRAYACAVLLDGVHVPGSPSGSHATLEAVVNAAKAPFAAWINQLLTRV
jgi:hypothetical protein